MAVESAWGEVRKLAADLQRLQLSSTAHRLTERSCIELVGTLMSRNILEVLYTLDGKEYVTEDQLVREVKQELVAHGGRINIVDLQQILNVDLSHVVECLNEMTKLDHSLLLLQGELIERLYMKYLCEEINDLLKETGKALLSDLSKNYNLPIKFLIEHIEEAMDNGIIHGYLNKSGVGVIYTEAYVKRYKSRIRGMCRALSVPLAIRKMITKGMFDERILYSLLQQLISSGDIAGTLQGRHDKAIFIPQNYIINQNKWADAFLDTNGYLEYDALHRLGIDEPPKYVSRRYSESIAKHSLVLLSTCCVNKVIITRIESVVEEEVLGCRQWVDAMSLLPGPCTRHDAELLLKYLWDSHPDVHLFVSIITTKSFLRECCDLFDAAISERGSQVAKEMYLPQTSSEKRKSISYKKGGIRKLPKGQGTVLSEESVAQTAFMTIDEITAKLTVNLPEHPHDLLIQVATTLKSVLQEKFISEIHKCVSSSSMKDISASERRRRHLKLQEDVHSLWNMLQLFEKANEHFQGEARIKLSRFLLHTVCSDLFNHVVSYIAQENGVELPQDMDFQMRQHVLSQFPAELKDVLLTVNKALSGKDVATFLVLFEGLCDADCCVVRLKKLDKKKERQLLHSHKQSLLQTLQSEQEPSVVFHLVVTILFQQSSNCAIHVSGKMLTCVLEFLNSHVQKEKYVMLTAFEELLRKYTCLQNECVKGADSARDNPNSEIDVLRKKLDDGLVNLKCLVYEVFH